MPQWWSSKQRAVVNCHSLALHHTQPAKRNTHAHECMDTHTHTCACTNMHMQKYILFMCIYTRQKNCTCIPHLFKCTHTCTCTMYMYVHAGRRGPSSASAIHTDRCQVATFGQEDLIGVEILLIVLSDGASDSHTLVPHLHHNHRERKEVIGTVTQRLYTHAS